MGWISGGVTGDSWLSQRWQWIRLGKIGRVVYIPPASEAYFFHRTLHYQGTTSPRKFVSQCRREDWETGYNPSVLLMLTPFKCCFTFISIKEWSFFYFLPFLEYRLSVWPGWPIERSIRDSMPILSVGLESRVTSPLSIEILLSCHVNKFQLACWRTRKNRERETSSQLY